MAFARASSIKIKINQDVESTHLNFKVKCVFFGSFQTTYIPSCTMKTMSKVQSEHT